MDPATLAAAAIAAAIPYLAAFGKEAAKGVAGGVGKSVWEWVKDKLSSPAGKAAIDDLEKTPEDEDSRKMAEAALAKFLRSDEKALGEMAKLLEAAGVTTGALTSTVIGNKNITTQAAGSGIRIAVNADKDDKENDKK